jgi:hypothetical protein
MSSETVIDVQPGIKTTPEPVSGDQSHMCGCERGFRKCCRCILNIPEGEDAGKCGASLSYFCDFRVYCLACPNDKGICLGVLFFPITCPVKFLCQAPCIGYNMCRNKCNGTTELEYLC